MSSTKVTREDLDAMAEANVSRALAKAQELQAQRTTKTVPTVYAKIAAVVADLAARGVGKNQTNAFDRYQFRGIDDVLNALAPALAKHGLVMLPEVTSHSTTERTSRKGEPLFHVLLHVTYHLVSAEDGSSHAVPVIGEAMDRGDKAINKAMSAAYKYAAFQAFSIPVEGQPDADAESHQVSTKRTAPDGSEVPTLEEAKELCADTLTEMQKAFEANDRPYAFQLWSELPAAYKMALWVAPSKGGPFTTEQRAAIKAAKTEAA